MEKLKVGDKVIARSEICGVSSLKGKTGIIAEVDEGRCPYLIDFGFTGDYLHTAHGLLPAPTGRWATEKDVLEKITT